MRTHSWFSLLEGASSLQALLVRAAACGYKTLALTDTNNLYGAVPFIDLAQRHGVRPVLGACLRQNRTRAVALIGDRAGYRSLCRVISRLHLTPDVPLPTLLSENCDGLHVLADDVVMAERLHEAFGQRLWLEVVRPALPGRPERPLLEFGRRHGIRPVASTAARMATPEEYPTLRIATVLRQNTLVERLPARLPITPAHHLVDMETLHRRFRDLPEAIQNTDRLAEQLRSDVLPHEIVLPRPQLPKNAEEAHYLERLCERGLRRRDLGGSLQARERLRHELAIIESAGLAGYFLVVRDIARYARRKGHSMALRGSAGNSLVCYLLQITDVNPLRFDLVLDRFLHPGRANLPDIDLDFDWKVRDEVIDHVIHRWGETHSARISTHLYLQPRSAFREAAKAHGLSDAQVSELLLQLEDRVDTVLSSPGEDVQLRIPKCEYRMTDIIADARRLLGRPHHLSLHPGGVVITPRPLEEYVPLQPAAKGVTMTQFEKDAVEHIGLVKIDLLGNRALSTADEAVRHARRICALKSEGCDLRFSDETDRPTLKLLRTGDTLGVTQLESPAMRHLLVQMRPHGLDDVIQALALLRPGVAGIGMKERFIRRRHGLEPVDPLHPLLEELRPTQGLMLYEDDALCVIQALTRLPVPDAARFYKRITRTKDEAECRQLADEFLAICASNGIPRPFAEEQWVQLSRFRHYTFCKSHAVSYGLIAWKATYLKAHYPLAFWTAALNNNQGAYPTRVYVEAIKRAGIPILLPCVNESRAQFTIEGNAIRTGLGLIASLEKETVCRLIEERERSGPYRDLAELRRRLSPGPEALDLLIRCGALDFTKLSRPELFLEAELQKRDHRPVAELFPHSAEAASWKPADYRDNRRLHDELRLLGFVTGPPLVSLYRPAKTPSNLVTSRDLGDHVGKQVSVMGLVATARHARMHDGRDMQFVTLEDEHGLIEVSLFPGTCPLTPYLTMGLYVATGTVEDHHGVKGLTARSFVPELMSKMH